MDAIQFEQSNKVLGPPPGMTNEECHDLPVWTDGSQCISLWRLSWKERFSALFFGRIWLCVLSGSTQPPVWLMATRQIFGKPKEQTDEEKA